MPRPPLSRAAAWLSATVLWGAVPPATLQAALAAAAGSIFEAVPFVLAAELLAGRRSARLIPSLGCGCSRLGLPGALSIPATAVAWLTFGPAVATGRFAAGLTLARLGARRTNDSGSMLPRAAPDAFAELTAIAAATLCAALASRALASMAWLARPDARAVCLLFTAGLALGALVPCATAAVAIAASLPHPIAPAAVGILCSAGLVPPLQVTLRATKPRSAGFASVSLALALAALAVRGPSGLVNPRLIPCIALASLVAAAGARRRMTSVPHAALLPCALLAALVVGTPAPQYGADPTSLASAFPGERLDFTGVTTTALGATTLERFAITCCRIDAAAVAVRLSQRLALPDGSWVAASGALVRAADGGLVLRPTSWRRLPEPSDPFVYR